MMLSKKWVKAGLEAPPTSECVTRPEETQLDLIQHRTDGSTVSPLRDQKVKHQIATVQQMAALTNLETNRQRVVFTILPARINP